MEKSPSEIVTTATTTASRIAGAMIGFAIGDALGATTEFMSAVEIKKELGTHCEINGGGWLELKPGEVTDDTEMMVRVAKSLVLNGHYCPEHMAQLLVEWYLDDPVDIGTTCRAGLHKFAKTGRLTRDKGEDQAGNGALMRVLPFALAHKGDIAGIETDILFHSHLTHNNEASDSACITYCYLVSNALMGGSKEDLATMAKLMFGDTSEAKPDNVSGYVTETLYTVLHCFFATDSFKEALVMCANLGGDADTNCAVLGGLAGAFYGEDNLPFHWVHSLDASVWHSVVGLARGLLEIREGKEEVDGGT